MSREMPPPGPERDALVAELVLGWIRNIGGSYSRTIEDNLAVLALPCWSTDDRAAVDVLLEMQRLGWDVVISSLPRRDGWGVSIFRGRTTGVGTDPFAAAVTEAAIRARWAEQDQ